MFFCLNYPEFKAVFTNLGAIGRLGPTSLSSHYNGQDHDGQVTVVSGIQRWTVPYTGDYEIEAIGAAGGYEKASKSRQYRGGGGRMIGTFHLSKGETIQILVGQQGGNNSKHITSGGGGGTFVVRASNTPLIIAGGGGGLNGAKCRHTECDASTSTSGRAGYKSWLGGSDGHGAQIADDDNSGESTMQSEQIFLTDFSSSTLSKIKYIPLYDVEHPWNTTENRRTPLNIPKISLEANQSTPERPRTSLEYHGNLTRTPRNPLKK